MAAVKGTSSTRSVLSVTLSGQRFRKSGAMGRLTSLPGEVSPRGLSSVVGKQEEARQQSTNTNVSTRYVA